MQVIRIGLEQHQVRLIDSAGGAAGSSTCALSYCSCTHQYIRSVNDIKGKMRMEKEDSSCRITKNDAPKKGSKDEEMLEIRIQGIW